MFRIFDRKRSETNDLTSMQWFEEWFDSPLYEWLYADRDEEEAAKLALLVERLIPANSYPEILDLGCGRGRHALTLADRGYRVTGVDLSEEAIRKARRKAEERGLKSVQFLIGDMREPLGRTFDAVVNLFTSFGYFEEDEENIKVIRSVRSMLGRGGFFLIDFMNAARVKARFEPSGEGEFNGIKYRIERYIENDSIYKKISFEGGSLNEPKEYVERVKLYEEPWFSSTFRDLGFETVERYGNYGGDPYVPDESSRLVMLVRKTD